jgi:hypothetical protein
MDRSFLSRPAVIDASRAYVCVRLATYEDQNEAEFLKGLVKTRSGELENSSFAILDPDGKRKLTTSGRGPRRLFADANALAEDLTRLAKPFADKSAPASLPVVANVRLAIDIAAADNLPLVILVGEGPTREALSDKVAPLVWGKDFIGRFTFVLADSDKDLVRVSGARSKAGLLVVQPDQFGLAGKVLAQESEEATAEEVRAALRKGVEAFARKPVADRSHIRQGREAKIFWNTPIPVTDPEEAQARRRGR